MLIGEVAAAARVGVQTLRFYERRGLVKPSRLVSGYRDYTPDTVAVIRFIKQSQEPREPGGLKPVDSFGLCLLLNLIDEPDVFSDVAQNGVTDAIFDCAKPLNQLLQIRDGLPESPYLLRDVVAF